MENNEELSLFPIKTKNIYKFKHMNGIYYLYRPEKIRDILKEELIKKEIEGKDDIQ